MTGVESERWFEVGPLNPRIDYIIVGKDSLGYKIDIHGVDPADHFEGGDTIQDRVSHVISILNNHIGPDSKWIDCETREPVHVWDALAVLSELEEW